ncbi:radical SAM protein [Methanocella arvoryzae]|uniref:Predicted redox-active protein (CxxC motif) n=1 Tax=Methanocella arvoryzae (strain DSM 22066 / NBRC 105507 / MRE50) TaxID=351160 RepID=Q0W708_METAR|nr:radical SAM protein [Methanocella arvoryzae]CAJ35835.1 predicted redox-active protein (CxxC motif) [Methanocella arvoryzae MRE50]
MPDISRTVILDGYVDEPACLGVPPYMAPYPRYVAGALPGEVLYYTIDQLRKDRSILQTMSSADLVVIISGVTVPGKYLGGTPATLQELERFMAGIDTVKILGGPVSMFGAGTEGGRSAKRMKASGVFDIVAAGDIEAVVAGYVQEGMAVDPDVRRTARDIAQWSVKGARIVPQHPDFPHTMLELETYRGCFRGNCSFCTEKFYGRPDFRPVTDIAAEVSALYDMGARYFRLGRQPDILTYMADGDEEFPRPNPEAIERLYSSIRKVAPQLKVLHMDNANPGTIARYPDESRAVLKSIVRHHTSGDVAAFGMESADPHVIRLNNLKAQPEEVKDAIRIVNEIGGARGASGLPELLPGLNFVHGLMGETKQTFRLNYEFLESLLAENLLVRRINVRQVMPFEGTCMADVGEKIANKHKGVFHAYKEKIREHIDLEMLKRVVPVGTVLRGVRMELKEGSVAFGRQIASYPLLVGIPADLEAGAVLDAKVVSHGYRSITAVPYPLDINHASLKTLESLPRVGKSRATRLAAGRPYMTPEEVRGALDDPEIARSLLEYFEYK